MNLREAALRAAVLRALADRIKEASDEARADVQRQLEDTGASQAKVDLAGQPIATVSLAGGKPTARIVDERAFLAWVQANRPTEVEVKVRESYRKAVLDADGADPASGEFVPGVEITDSTPYVSVRFTGGGRAAVAAAWQSGALTEIAGTPALTGGVV